VRRLTAAWQEEHERWQQRDLSARRYVYLWADGGSVRISVCGP
jgi:putative transposase